MEKYISARAICPFYKHENKSVIYCEGVEEASVIHLAFARPSACFDFKKAYCKKNYSDCPIAAMLTSIADGGGLKQREDILSSLF